MNKLFFAMCFLGVGCMHSGGMMMGQEAGMGMDDRESGRNAAWPSVRIEEPAGARFTMELGLFGDGLDVVAPFQGQFQTTGSLAMTGYPLEIHLDQEAARRYGAAGATTLYARLTVAPTLKHEAVRIAPSECELRALLTGEVDELRLVAHDPPPLEERCAMEGPALPPGHPPIPGYGPNDGGAMCPHGGGHSSPHGCGGGSARSHGGWHHSAPTVLKIRLVKF